MRAYLHSLCILIFCVSSMQGISQNDTSLYQSGILLKALCETFPLYGEKFEVKMTSYGEKIQEINGSYSLDECPSMNEDYFIIPVVAHNVYEGSSIDQDYLEYADLLLMIENANLWLSGWNSSLPIPIKLCIATEPMGSYSGQPITWSNSQEPGVMRYPTDLESSQLAIYSYESQESMLEITHHSAPHSVFPFENYLNIWFVQKTTPSLLEGYPLPPGENHLMDGILFQTSQVTYSDYVGILLLNSLGHYLGLLHTDFNTASCSQICTSSGDFICDTPPSFFYSLPDCIDENSCSTDLFGSGIGSFAELEEVPFMVFTDVTEVDAFDASTNIMNYYSCTSETFSPMQRDFMSLYLQNERPELSEVSNWINTGVANSTGCLEPEELLSASIISDMGFSVCKGVAVEFSCPIALGFSNTSCSWIIDGMPFSGAAVSYIFTEQGQSQISLTVSDGISECQTNQSITVFSCDFEEDDCNKVCNAGFEMNMGNLNAGQLANATFGTVDVSCETDIEQVNCWQSGTYFDVISATGSNVYSWYSPLVDLQSWNHLVTDNSNYIRLEEYHFVNDLFAPGVNETNWNSSVTQALHSPISGNLVVEYMMAYSIPYANVDLSTLLNTGLNLGLSAQTESCAMFDLTGQPLAGVMNDEYLSNYITDPDNNGIIVVSPENHWSEWRYVVDGTEPVGSVSFYPNENVISNSTYSINYYIDDVCVTKFSDNPISFVPPIFGMEYSSCQNGIVQIDLNIVTDFPGVTSMPTLLTIAASDGSYFDYTVSGSGASMIGSNMIQIEQGVIDQDGAQITLLLHISETAPVGNQYFFSINQTSGACICHEPYFIVNVVEGMSIQSTSDLSICPELSVGFVTLSVSDATGNVEYEWAGTGIDGVSEASIENLGLGEYSVLISDDLCTIQQQFVVVGDAEECCDDLVFDYLIETIPVSCPEAADGGFNIQIAIDCDDYEVSWTGPQDFVSSGSYIENLIPGTYTAVITTPYCSCTEQVIELILPLPLWSYPTGIVVTESNQNLLANDWTGNEQSFGDDIVFSSGTMVTIGNSNFETVFNLSSVADIFIEEGADITFINCIFTSCGNNWRGIDVMANHSTVLPSGKLTLNSCRVENAVAGIYTSDEALTNLSLTQRHGGNILCTSTTFSNCRVAFEAYKATKLSGQNLPGVGFRKCRFELDDQMLSHFPDSEGAYNQFSNLVRMNESYGYSFQGCTFENSMVTNIEQWSNRGRAIRSSKSVYNVESYQINVNDPAIRSSFSGFDVAIDASQASKRAVIVRFSDFEKNRVGIRLTNMPFFQVYENTFSIGELVEADPLNTQNPNTQDVVVVGYEDQVEETAPIWYEGIFVNGGHSFVLAENRFDGAWESEGGVNDDFTRIGVRVRDTKTKDDEIRLNTFQDLTVANLANGDNADAANNSGLRYICNTHIDNRFDIQVDDYAGASDVAIDIVQDDVSNDGEETQWSADNTFTQDPDILEEAGRIWNDGIEITYIFDGEGEENLDPTGETYNVIPEDDDVEGSNDCLEEWQSETEHTVAHINGLLTRANEIQGDVVANEVLFLSVLDQGSTVDLKQQIENAYGEDVLDKRDYLLSISPHVSQTILRTVADRTDQYPHAIALEIFLANPDVLRDNRFMEYLATKTDPMPQYMIDILYAASSQTTQRTIIMNEWNRAQTIFMKDMNRALWAMSYLDDYNEIDMEEVIFGLATLESEFSAIDELLDASANSAAQDRFDGISETFYLPEDLSMEADLFANWMALRIALKSSNRTWVDISPTELEILYNFVDHYKTWTGRAAMQVLNEYHSEIFQLPPAFSQQWNPRATNASGTSVSFVEAFPNPASTYVIFQLNSPFETLDNIKLKITDITGKFVTEESISSGEINFVLDVSMLASGIYLFEMSLTKYRVETGRFTVQH